MQKLTLKLTLMASGMMLPKLMSQLSLESKDGLQKLTLTLKLTVSLTEVIGLQRQKQQQEARCLWNGSRKLEKTSGRIEMKSQKVL